MSSDRVYYPENKLSSRPQLNFYPNGLKTKERAYYPAQESFQGEIQPCSAGQYIPNEVYSDGGVTGAGNGVLIGSEYGAYEDLRVQGYPWIVYSDTFTSASVGDTRTLSEEIKVKFDDMNSWISYAMAAPYNGTIKLFNNVPFLLESTSIQKEDKPTSNGNIYAVITKEWKKTESDYDKEGNFLTDSTPPWMYKIEDFRVSTESQEETMEYIYPDMSYFSSWVLDAYIQCYGEEGLELYHEIMDGAESETTQKMTECVQKISDIYKKMNQELSNLSNNLQSKYDALIDAYNSIANEIDRIITQNNKKADTISKAIKEYSTKINQRYENYWQEYLDENPYYKSSLYDMQNDSQPVADPVSLWETALQKEIALKSRAKKIISEVEKGAKKAIAEARKTASDATKRKIELAEKLSQDKDAAQEEYDKAVEELKNKYKDELDPLKEERSEYISKLKSYNEFREKLADLEGQDFAVPFRNSAGRPLEGTHSRDLLKIEFTYNVPEWDWSFISKYKNKVNQYSLYIAGYFFEARSLLLSDITATHRKIFDENGLIQWTWDGQTKTDYWVVSMSLLFDEKTFNQKYLNVGQHVVDKIQYRVYDHSNLIEFNKKHYKMTHPYFSEIKFEYKTCELYEGQTLSVNVKKTEPILKNSEDSSSSDLTKLGCFKWFLVDSDDNEIDITEYEDNDGVKTYKNNSSISIKSDYEGYKIKCSFIDNKNFVGMFNITTSEYVVPKNILSDVETKTKDLEQKQKTLEYWQEQSTNNPNNQTAKDSVETYKKFVAETQTVLNELLAYVEKNGNKESGTDVTDTGDIDSSVYENVVISEEKKESICLANAELDSNVDFTKIFKEVTPFDHFLPRSTEGINLCEIQYNKDYAQYHVDEGFEMVPEYNEDGTVKTDENGDIVKKKKVISQPYTQYVRSSLSPIYYYKGQYYSESQIDMMGVKDECENDAINEPMFLNDTGDGLMKIGPDGRQFKSYLVGCRYLPIDFSDLSIPEVG